MSEQKPLTGKYAKLAEDLRVALATGRAAEIENPEDGGTCNFDSPAIYLPKWRKSLVEQAAREAGCGCFDISTGCFLFMPDTGGQGNARTRNARAMTNKLKELGYKASVHYQMD